jgi:hemerythrin-like domain-containing protein
MATTQSTQSKAAKSSHTTTTVKRFDGKTVRQPLAFAFLMQQHREVEALFDEYENTENNAKKLKLSEEICLALAVHAKIEEELLYPEAQDKIEEPDLVDEASVEHATAKDLIAQIETMKVGDKLYDAKMKVLSEYIAHHVEEEETELFPEIKRTDIDLTEIAGKLEARAEQVKAQLSSGGEAATRAKVAADAKAGAHI